MTPPVIGGQQLAQRGEQVSLTSRAGFNHREAGRRVRHPHMQQALPRLDAAEKGVALRRDVVDLFP